MATIRSVQDTIRQLTRKLDDADAFQKALETNLAAVQSDQQNFIGLHTQLCNQKRTLARDLKRLEEGQEQQQREIQQLETERNKLREELRSLDRNETENSRIRADLTNVEAQIRHLNGIGAYVLETFKSDAANFEKTTKEFQSKMDRLRGECNDTFPGHHTGGSPQFFHPGNHDDIVAKGAWKKRGGSGSRMASRSQSKKKTSRRAITSRCRNKRNKSKSKGRHSRVTKNMKKKNRSRIIKKSSK